MVLRQAPDARMNEGCARPGAPAAWPRVNDAQQQGPGRLASAITTAIVQLHTECYGKGPTRAKTHLADDTVLVVLRDGLTRLEKSLQAAGRGDLVRAARMVNQEATEERFRAVIERETGRRVLTYASQVTLDPVVMIEFFLLEPDPA